MTTELIYLIATMMLAASMWIPYIVGINMTPGGGPADFTRPPDLHVMPAWVHRAHRAHLNLLETATPFAALIILAHVLEVSTTVTVAASVAFFWLRVAHAVGMISGLANFPLRPIIFSASWLCTLAVGVQLLLT